MKNQALYISRRELLTRMTAPGLCIVGLNSAGPLGTALLLEVKEKRLLTAEDSDIARRWVAAPGSTIKPFTLLALIEKDKLSSRDEYMCPGKLVLGGRTLNCSHPALAIPMNPSRAISYSCNCAVAHFAERFEDDELPYFLKRIGLSSATGLLGNSEAVGSVRTDLTGAYCQLEALGEEGLRVSALELLMAYRRLAVRVTEPQMAPIIEGLEGAVDFGTAQAARLPHIRVAGKTGSVLMDQGVRAAWFAGFAPSRSPEVAITILVQGRSGGADAAPIAGKILRDYFRRRA